MKTVIKIMLLLTVVNFAIAEEEPVMQHGQPEVSARTRRMSNQFGNDITSGKFKHQTYLGLDALIHLAAYKLRRIGEKEMAADILNNWKTTYQFQYMDMLDYTDIRHIGDHGAVIQWLKDTMIKLEDKLGASLMYDLRLSDIRTFNETPKVVFFCQDHVSEQEYWYHFVDDTASVQIRGLAPTTVYWTSFITCVGGTWGTGFLFCSPISMGVEYLTKKVVAPKLNHPLWQRACGSFK